MILGCLSFALLGIENSRLYLNNQSDAKLETNLLSVTSVFPRFLPSTCRWLMMIFIFVLITMVLIFNNSTTKTARVELEFSHESLLRCFINSASMTSLGLKSDFNKAKFFIFDQTSLPIMISCSHFLVSMPIFCFQECTKNVSLPLKRLSIMLEYITFVKNTTLKSQINCCIVAYYKLKISN